MAIFDGTRWKSTNSAQLQILLTDATQTGSVSGTTLTTTSTAQLVPGMQVTASGGTGTLAASTTISSITSATTCTLNNAASVNGTLTTITFKLPASTLYDVILVNDGGTLRLLFGPAWTSATARASALKTQNGINVNSGSWTTGWTNSSATVATTTGLYLGTIYTTTTVGQTEDSVLNRLVWNTYNRARRKLLKQISTSNWTYGVASWRQSNADTTNQVAVVCGLAGWSVAQVVAVGEANGAVTAAIGIGINSTTAPSDVFGEALGTTNTCQNAAITDMAAQGYTYYAHLEYARTGANTFYGTAALADIQAGLSGSYDA